MAIYAELVADVRGHTQASRQARGDKYIARMIRQGFTRLIREAAKRAPNDHRLPRVITSVSAPSDLTDGFTLPTRVRLVEAEAVYSDGHRTDINIIPPERRWDYVRPLPAAYVMNSTLEPVAGDGYGQIVNHAAMLEAGWKDVASVSLEVIEEAPAVTALDQTITIDELFHDAAAWYAASVVDPSLVGRYSDALTAILEELTFDPTENETVVDVMGY